MVVAFSFKNIFYNLNKKNISAILNQVKNYEKSSNRREPSKS